MGVNERLVVGDNDPTAEVVESPVRPIVCSSIDIAPTEEVIAKPERATSREDSPQFSTPQVSWPQPAVCWTLVVTEPIEVADCKPV